MSSVQLKKQLADEVRSSGPTRRAQQPLNEIKAPEQSTHVGQTFALHSEDEGLSKEGEREENEIGGHKLINAGADLQAGGKRSCTESGSVQATGATDMSFEEALNRRDMAEVDRSVENLIASGSKASFNFDEPDAGEEVEEDTEVEDNANSPEELNLLAGQAEGDPVTPSADRAVEDRIKRVLEAKAEHGLPKRFKLESKSEPAGTDYTMNALVVKSEQKRLKEIESEAAKKKLKIEKASTAQAVVAIVNQPDLTHNVEHIAGANVAGPGAPHETHDMRQFAATDAVIIFCDTCGRWQRHGAGRSKLGMPCAPILEGMKSQRKLLRHQIVPVNGAKLPASVKTPGGKRC